MKRSSSIALSLLVAAWFVSGCEDECGPGYESFEHLCRVAGGEADGGEGSADAAAGAAGVAGAAECESSTFGDTCLTLADCECDADFCAGLPGEEGFCTRTGCDETPSVCPSEWGCMDLSRFGPDLPAICTPL